jgi:hypothetical protein
LISDFDRWEPGQKACLEVPHALQIPSVPETPWTWSESWPDPLINMLVSCKNWHFWSRRSFFSQNFFQVVSREAKGQGIWIHDRVACLVWGVASYLFLKKITTRIFLSPRLLEGIYN